MKAFLHSSSKASTFWPFADQKHLSSQFKFSSRLRELSLYKQDKNKSFQMRERAVSVREISTTKTNKKRKQKQQQSINCKTQPNRESNTFQMEVSSWHRQCRKKRRENRYFSYLWWKTTKWFFEDGSSGKCFLLLNSCFHGFFSSSSSIFTLRTILTEKKSPTHSK